MSASILIVEDEPVVVDTLQVALRREGFEQVSVVSTGEQAVRAIGEDPPGLLILDLDLPDAHVLEASTAEPADDAGFPVLFFTDGECDSRTLASFGARLEDCLDKPLDPAEAVSRVRTLLRRSGATRQTPSATVYDFERFQVIPAEGRLVVEGHDVPTPSREFALLTFLAQRAGQPHQANDLYLHVWHARPLGACDQNTVSVHVRRLREKIEPDPAHPRYLVTERGQGYKLVIPGK